MRMDKGRKETEAFATSVAQEIASWPDWKRVNMGLLDLDRQGGKTMPADRKRWAKVSDTALVDALIEAAAIKHAIPRRVEVKDARDEVLRRLRGLRRALAISEWAAG